VKNPVRLRVVPLQGVSVDTHAGYLSNAHDQGLDRISLKSRVVRQMLALDKNRARQMVFEIGGKLNLKPLECSATLVPEISAIYAVVSDVAKRSFTDEEVTEGVRGLFVVPWLESIESPGQIGPALDLLIQLQKGSPAEKQLLYSALSRAIRKDFKDDRSFTFAIERDRLSAKVAKLVSGPDDPAAKAEMISAFKEFLVENFRAPRCRDNELKDREQVPPVLRDANFLFPDKPLAPDDILHTELKDGPNVIHFWRSVDSRRLMIQFRNLREEKEKVNESENRSVAEWETKVGVFLENLGMWNASEDESETAVFNQKCVLFSSLVSTVPKGKVKRTVVDAYLRFLSSSSVQKTSYIEWLYFARRAASGFPALFDEVAPQTHNPSFAVMTASIAVFSSDSRNP
jgi:hypothetical protein